MVIPFSMRYNITMIYFVLAILIMILSLVAQSHVQRVFREYAQTPAARGIYAG